MTDDLFERLRELLATDPSAAKRTLEVLRFAGNENLDAMKHIAESITDEHLVALLRARSSVNESIVYAHHVYAEIDALIRQHAGEVRDILEIGPGANLGALFCFTCAGARTATGIDIADTPPMTLSFYKSLAAYLACVEGFRWWRYFSAGNRFPGIAFPNNAEPVEVGPILDRIELLSPYPADAIPLSNASYDVVYSVAALEHVNNPTGVVNEIHRLLRPGGLAIHEIDLKHHGSGDPLRFLEMTEEEWARISSPYGNEHSLNAILNSAWQGEVYCNRIRMSDWLRHFREAGFEIELIEPLVTLEPHLVRKERFHPVFREYSDDDLAIVAFRMVARA